MLVSWLATLEWLCLHTCVMVFLLAVRIPWPLTANLLNLLWGSADHLKYTQHAPQVPPGLHLHLSVCTAKYDLVHRLLIGRDGHLDQSGACKLGDVSVEYYPVVITLLTCAFPGVNSYLAKKVWVIWEVCGKCQDEMLVFMSEGGLYLCSHRSDRALYLLQSYVWQGPVPSTVMST